MTQFDTVQKLGRDSFDASVASFGVASADIQAIVAETVAYRFR